MTRRKMSESLTDRIELYFASLPPPTGRTFHQMQPETLLSECRTTIDLQRSVIIGYQNRIADLEKALRSIAANTCCDKCQEAALVARAALAESGEK